MSAPATQAQANGNGAASSHETLAAALLAVQAEVPAVEPDATNPHFKSKFVSLGNLISKVRPVLNRHGLAFAQFPSTDFEGKPTLVTLLLHESGERMEYAAPLLLSKSDPQGHGAAITYMRRYALASALGVCDQEDPDSQRQTNGGARPKGDVPELDADQVDRIMAALKAAEWTGGQISLAFGAVGAEAQAINRADSIEKAVRNLTSEQADEFEKALTDAG